MRVEVLQGSEFRKRQSIMGQKRHKTYRDKAVKKQFFNRLQVLISFFELSQSCFAFASAASFLRIKV